LRRIKNVKNVFTSLVKDEQNFRRCTRVSK